MNCPVCIADISNLDFSDRLSHCNKCISLSENGGDVPQTNCPICGKASSNHVMHLKTCSKENGVLPRDLVKIINQSVDMDCSQIPAKINFKVTKQAKQPRAPAKKRVPKSPSTKKPRAKATKKVKLETEAVVVKQEQDKDDEVVTHVVSSFFTNESTSLIRPKDGRMTRIARLTRGDIDQKIKLYIDNIAQNHACDSNDPPPLSWLLSSMTIGSRAAMSYVANGFDKYVPSSFEPIELSHNCDDKKTIYCGFVIPDEVVSSVMVVDDSSYYYQKLNSFANNPRLSDLTVTLQDGKQLRCHSLLWKMNCQKHEIIKLIKSGHWDVDLSNFKRQSIIAFVKYLYSGNLTVDDTCIEDLKRLLQHVGCQRLIDKLNTMSTNL